MIVWHRTWKRSLGTTSTLRKDSNAVLALKLFDVLIIKHIVTRWIKSTITNVSSCYALMYNLSRNKSSDASLKTMPKLLELHRFGLDTSSIKRAGMWGIRGWNTCHEAFMSTTYLYAPNGTFRVASRRCATRRDVMMGSHIDQVTSLRALAWCLYALESVHTSRLQRQKRREQQRQRSDISGFRRR